MHPFMSQVAAELRSRELQKQADYSRLVASCARPAPAGRGRLFRVRRAVGVRLIRAGLRLTTTHH